MKIEQPKYKIGDKAFYLIQFTGTPFSGVVRLIIKSIGIYEDRIRYGAELDKKWKHFLKNVDHKLRERIDPDFDLIEMDLAETPEEARDYALPHYEDIIRNMKRLNF